MSQVRRRIVRERHDEPHLEDHPEEMRGVERQREEAFEDHERLTTDPDDVRD